MVQLNPTIEPMKTVEVHAFSPQHYDFSHSYDPTTDSITIINRGTPPQVIINALKEEGYPFAEQARAALTTHSAKSTIVLSRTLIAEPRPIPVVRIDDLPFEPGSKPNNKYAHQLAVPVVSTEALGFKTPTVRITARLSTREQASALLLRPGEEGRFQDLISKNTIHRMAMPTSYATGVADEKIGPESRNAFYKLMDFLGVKKTHVQTRILNGESALSQLQKALAGAASKS